MIVFFLFGGLAISGLVREMNKKTGIPYTPMLFIIGIFIGKFYQEMGLLGQSIYSIRNIDPHGILMIFYLYQYLKGDLIVTGILSKNNRVLQYDDSYYSWSGAFMFGSILSCTDTVAVLALLKEVGAPKKLNSLIEGESLLNDGTCMVLFEISSKMVKGQQMLIFDIIKLFLTLTVGGALLGIFIGLIASFWIGRIHNDAILTVNVTFIAAYLCFFIAENVDLGIQISGIMALVSLGLFMSIFGKTKISIEEEKTVHIFWKYVVYAAESIIFLLAGIIVGIRVLNNLNNESFSNGQDQYTIIQQDYFKLFGLYICMILSRFGSIALVMKWLRKWGYGLSWKDVYVLTYGGLRGAIGISFALIVANDYTDAYSQKFRDIVLFDMAGNALLTLIINSTTAGVLIKSLGLCVISNVRQKTFMYFLEGLKEDTIRKMNLLKNNQYLQMVNWNGVKDLIGIPEYEKKIQQIEVDIQKREKEEDINIKLAHKNPIELELIKQKEILKLENESADSSQNLIDEDMVVECRNRYLIALKGIYWIQFEKQQCSSNALLLLIESVNWDIDTQNQRMNSWEFLSNYINNPFYIQILFYLKTWPIIGEIAGNMLFNHISHIYDVLSTYIEAHESAEEVIKEFRIQEQVQAYIVRESYDNRLMAEEYIQNYLHISFPEISKMIQTKKAAFSLLESQRKLLEDSIRLGQIDDKQFKTVKNHIEKHQLKLDNIKPSWKSPPVKEFLKNIKFFEFIPDVMLDKIIYESIEIIIEKDNYIVKEGERAKYLFVITRGRATEICTQTFYTYNENKLIGNVLFIHQLVLPELRYLTSCIADAMVYVLAFPLQSLQNIIKMNQQMEDYVWQQSFMTITQLYYNQLKPLSNLNKQIIKDLIPQMRFAKYKKNQTIDFQHGGVLLKGNVYKKDMHNTNSGFQIIKDCIKTKEQQDKQLIQSFAVFLPHTVQYLYTIDSNYIIKESKQAEEDEQKQ
ncbi:sodium hydrogen exchanger family protein, putative [Ichthyophthirius multifiliis]|uniref:Sodium hydrogen exchanger family protein, putative n=1 Tax=Ichthyophthirius multifiliis TaxID=5932 RepID=G0QW29_ICHMU|nr:sodium hydrogen exchanger family protein, putative [Ichthyophthirius multifiliis]EGR30581.1 sodium hydrogen exchanger family protein, putative [Ichthyophthirius multifiliis]|eukprot:XP_004032168.1 sodium hydrogen exchanger family protein, putative [Ichthyophthirius multifiliis]